MGYLLIKKDDVKTFRSFLSGNEIEVGVRVGSQANVFHPDEEVHIFYGNEDTETTNRARITGQNKLSTVPGNNALVMLGLVKQ